MTDTQKNKQLRRLYFKTYMQFIRNSVGSNMFRNFYVESESKGVFDALDDGENSCAFYVSAVLVIFKKLNAVHGTVARTVDDLRSSGWVEVNNAQLGDVLVWEARQFADGVKEHIGFSIGGGRAISSSSITKSPTEHDEHFDNANRKIIHIFRQPNWEDNANG